jgi:hypothetical protein
MRPYQARFTDPDTRYPGQHTEMRGDAKVPRVRIALTIGH